MIALHEAFAARSENLLAQAAATQNPAEHLRIENELEQLKRQLEQDERQVMLQAAIERGDEARAQELREVIQSFQTPQVTPRNTERVLTDAEKLQSGAMEVTR